MTANTMMQLIEKTYERMPSTHEFTAEEKEAVEAAIAGLDEGHLRVAEHTEEGWHINQWLKQAILLYFRMNTNHRIEGGAAYSFDKIDLKYQDYNEEQFKRHKVRVVPGSQVRYGAYIAPGVVLMPSYVNIGAYIGANSMVDTWATVGSCAQIGKHVHISGGAGIGGVLEPLQASPTIIEDHCFIGARSEVAEGVIIEKGAVLGMGVFLSQSTKIYNRQTGEITRGRVPAGSVVVPGSLPSDDGSHSKYCAIIVKQVDEQTRAKTSINELLREA